uniref:Peptidase M14 carboxypeptidase A domain-containing protein n=1 Tax=Panagrolaimus sp. JU765 TaxID=591449 RepID=A0AC34RBP9_9BILA
MKVFLYLAAFLTFVVGGSLGAPHIYTPIFPAKFSELPRKVTDRFDFGRFHSYDEILTYSKTLNETFAEFLNVEVIGQTFENRPMILLKFGDLYNNSKPIIFIDGGIHAREWISPATVLSYIHHIIAKNESFSEIFKIVNIFILPVVNPDGYEYSRTTSRMWRKNRSGPRGPFKKCYGVDLNRNFGFKWAVAGTSTNPCDSEIYHGSKPNSEPETLVLEKVLWKYRKQIKAYLTAHSYGGEILYPWGYAKGVYPKDVEDLIKLGNKMKNAIKKHSGTEYKVMPSAGLYPAAGASDDYAKSLGIKYSYTIEIYSENHFLEKEENIPIRSKEIKVAVDTVVQQIVQE